MTKRLPLTRKPWRSCRKARSHDWASAMSICSRENRKTRWPNTRASLQRIQRTPPPNFRVAEANLRAGPFRSRGIRGVEGPHNRPCTPESTLCPGDSTRPAWSARDTPQRELEQFRKLEAEARSDTDRNRNIVVLNRGAAAKLLEGHPEEAVEMFLTVIESYPDSPTHYLNLGIVQSKLGRHKAGSGHVSEDAESRDGDNFLVYRNLAQEYELLGDMEAQPPSQGRLLAEPRRGLAGGARLESRLKFMQAQQLHPIHRCVPRDHVPWRISVRPSNRMPQ